MQRHQADGGPRRALDRALLANPHVLLSLTMLFWAGNFVVARASAGHVPPVALAWLRWTVAMLLVLPFGAKHLRSDWPAIRRAWPILVLLGLVGAGLFNTLQYLALNYTTALNALLINSSGPIFVALACLVLFGDRIGLLQALGITVSLAGVLMVGTKGAPAALATVAFAPGDLIMLAAMALWGVYTACLRRCPEIHWMSFLLAQMAIASAVNLPLFLWEWTAVAPLQATTATVLTVAYVAIFPSILAYDFFTRGVQLIGGSRAGVYIHLATLFGSALSVLVLGERLEAYHVIGFALILAGVTVAARDPVR